MDTTLLYNKIKRFDEVAPGKFAKEITHEFESWVKAFDKYIEELSWEEMKVHEVIHKQEELIDFLVKLLVITGNSDKLMLSRVMDPEIIREAVDFLFKLKDKQNHNNIYTIGVLLYLAKRDGKQINNLVDLVTYARTGK